MRDDTYSNESVATKSIGPISAAYPDSTSHDSRRHGLISAPRARPIGMSARLRVYVQLGVRNLWRVAMYRLKKSSGVFTRTMPIGAAYEGPFFSSPSARIAKGDCEPTANESRSDFSYMMFSHLSISTNGPPDWFVNPLNGARADAVDEHWSRTKDFSATLGDIKTVWEASRFDWLPKCAWQVACEDEKRGLAPFPTDEKRGQAPFPNGPSGAAQKGASPRFSSVSPRFSSVPLSFDLANQMESWVADWVRHNPVNQGPNWRCGQEVSVRALNMLLTGKILGILDDPLPAYLRFLAEHASRIPPTLSYAVGQDTNHATTEACALFLLGHYLEQYAVAGARRWQFLGRYWLEDRIGHLIAVDGSFAQYSVNYHRLLLMTLGLVEAFRREWKIDRFTDRFYERLAAATRWMAAMTDPVSGDAPNLGPNDGADLFNIDSRPYRDFRGAVDFARMVFLGESQDGNGTPLGQLFGGHSGQLSEPPDAVVTEIAKPTTAPPPGTASCSGRFPLGRVSSDGGYVRLAASEDCWGVIRFASFDFRPKECDILHLDLWRDGVNVLRDGGTYSYAEASAAEYFSGTASHNTVQFDGRDQMRRIGPFLFADWVRMDDVSEVLTRKGAVSWSGGYRDYEGRSHHRSVTATEVDWRIADTIDGFSTAVIRWRLVPGDWLLDGNRLRGHLATLSIESTCEHELRLGDGRESRWYMHEQALPVLEIHTTEVGTYRTTITWH